MRLFAAAATVLCLIDICLAAYAPYTNSSDVTFTSTSSEQSTCGNSTYSLADGLAPADWEECTALWSTWSDKGVFTICSPTDDKAYVPLLMEGRCTLAVRATGDGEVQMGSGDVKNVMEKALKGFSEGTDLRVRGKLGCDVEGGGRMDVQWEIYDSTA